MQKMGFWAIVIGVLVFGSFTVSGQDQPAESTESLNKVYVPYDALKDVFEKEGQGVFLPYGDFMRLWQKAKGAPTIARKAPLSYLVSSSKFTGQIDGDLARVQLDLTIDVLKEGWVEVPVGLGKVAVETSEFTASPVKTTPPLLQLKEGHYYALLNGRGRWVLRINFVRQLVSKPGQNILKFDVPRAAISTLELTIPEENVGVDINPMLAATTSNDTVGDKKVTKLKAFLGDSRHVTLTWKPQSQSDSTLPPVIIANQQQLLHVSEALINYDMQLTYNIHRRGVKQFSVRMPASFRITSVKAEGMSKWEVTPSALKNSQNLVINLFSPVKGTYRVMVRMEKFLEEETAELDIPPTATANVSREMGVLGISRTTRRSVEVVAPEGSDSSTGLMRVDLAKLPRHAQNKANMTAYSFSSTSYGFKLKINKVDPRIDVRQRVDVGVLSENLQIRSLWNYSVRKAGVFSTSMTIPKSWTVERIEPASLVDDFEVVDEGEAKSVNVTLKSEQMGEFSIILYAKADRKLRDAPVALVIPSPSKDHLRSFKGSFILHLHESLRAELLKETGLTPEPLRKLLLGFRFDDLSPVMAYKFQGLKQVGTAGAEFKISTKPSQISAVVNRVAHLKSGSIEHEAVIGYRIRYAPVGTFYLKLPKAMESTDYQIHGSDIKESPRVEKLPEDIAEESKETAEREWIYHKVVLQSPRSGSLNITVRWRESLRVGENYAGVDLPIHPVLAAGALTDQIGYIAITKAPSLAVTASKTEHLTPGDPSSPIDIPYAVHRKDATMAFKHSASDYTLILKARQQKDAAVFTTIVNGMIIQQVIGRDGALNAKATMLISTSRGDRLPISIAKGASFYSFYLNGKEVPVETTADGQRVVRLPHSSQKVSRITLEVTYKVDNASLSTLPAPELPESIPVQRTYWQLWIPDDYHLIGYNRDFAPMDNLSVHSLVSAIGNSHDSSKVSSFPAQGMQYTFSRQGAVAQFSVSTMKREIFALLIWVIIVGAGIYLLRYNGFIRILSVLGIALALSIIGLFAPLFAGHAGSLTKLSLLLVIIMWFAHWLFINRKNRRAMQMAGGPDAGVGPTNEKSTKAQPAKEKTADDQSEKPKRRRRRKPKEQQDDTNKEG